MILNNAADSNTLSKDYYDTYSRFAHDVYWFLEKPVYKPHPYFEVKNVTLLPFISRGL